MSIDDRYGGSDCRGPAAPSTTECRTAPAPAPQILCRGHLPNKSFNLG